MKNLSALSDREKEQLLRYLGKIYRRGTQYVKMGWRDELHTHNEDADMEMASKIRMILRSMDHDGALILYHDFFDIQTRDWWRKDYSAPMYTKCKRAAMNQLLTQLYR